MGNSTAFGTDATLVGRVTAKSVRVLGRFEGRLDASGDVFVAGSGRVKARVRARSVRLEGEFEGQILAERLVFGPTARASGAFLADRVCIEEGALVDGVFNIEEAVAELDEGLGEGLATAVTTGGGAGPSGARGDAA